MFDSLKEKIGQFRDDVEETAEQKAEEAADADAEGDPESGADADAEAVEAETTDEADAAATAGIADGDAADGGGVTDAGTDGSDPTVDESLNGADPSETPNGDAADASATADGVADEESESEADADADDEDEDKDGDGDDDGGTGFGRKVKSLARGKFVIEEEDLEDPLWELEMALLESDVEMSVAEEILDGVRDQLVGETRSFRESTGDIVEDALREALLDVISVGQFDFDERVRETDRPVVIVFTGVNGVGKTTTIAKLSQYLERRGLSTVLANGDTYRAGANEQIGSHADALGTKLISHEQGGDPAAVVYDAVEYAEANDIDVVLGDTAGRLHTDQGLMDQLEKIGRVVGPDMTLFVDEAVAGQDAVRRAQEFDDAVAVDGSVLTKADADSQGGAAISIAHVTGRPILFLGTGQGYDDLERFDPEVMVDRLLSEE